MSGFKYTYFQNYGEKLSKLDRILVCPDFTKQFLQAACTALPRELSDHCPILLELCSLDFGPIPFKLFNSWILQPGYNDVVLQAISEFKGYGSPDIFFS